MKNQSFTIQELRMLNAATYSKYVGSIRVAAIDSQIWFDLNQKIQQYEQSTVPLSDHSTDTLKTVEQLSTLLKPSYSVLYLRELRRRGIIHAEKKLGLYWLFDVTKVQHELDTYLDRVNQVENKRLIG